VRTRALDRIVSVVLLAVGVMGVVIAPQIPAAGKAKTKGTKTPSAKVVKPKGAKPSPSTTSPSIGVKQKPVTGGWWNNRVFYEIFVRSFYDSNGDGIGDLRGAIEKLPYLNDLGVNAVWLMPVTDGNTYHGYTVTNYTGIETDYGTLDDMRAYVQAAHALDIKVIVDLVVNHTSDQHPWFVEAQNVNSPKHDWYLWSKTDPKTRGPWGQQVWHSAGNGLFYFGLFDRSQPDLNLKNPEVTKELERIGTFWLQDVDVDGFRLDAASHLIEDGSVMENTPATLAWWRTFSARMKAVKNDAFLIGEVNGPARPSASYVPDALDATFQFDLARGLIKGVLDQDPGRINVEQSVGADLYGAGNQFGSFLTNHDQPRVFTALGDVTRARVAMAELLTRPGIPFLYYGEEVGLAGAKPDEQIRTPMPWTSDAQTAGFTKGIPWESPAVGFQISDGGRNVASQRANPTSLWSAYHSLIELRRNEPALGTTAQIKKVAVTVRVVGSVANGTAAIDAYVRSEQGKRVLVVHNLSRSDLETFAGNGPIEVDLAMSEAAAKTEIVQKLGWTNDPTIRVSGTVVTIAGPIPSGSTLIVRLG
jgi:alpha-amylase